MCHAMWFRFASHPCIIVADAAECRVRNERDWCRCDLQERKINQMLGRGLQVRILSPVLYPFVVKLLDSSSGSLMEQAEVKTHVNPEFLERMTLSEVNNKQTPYLYRCCISISIPIAQLSQRLLLQLTSPDCCVLMRAV